MKPVILLPLLLFLVVPIYGQSPVRSSLAVDLPVNDQSVATNAEESLELARATRAIKALTRLDNHVLVYRSQADFDESGKLARVSLEHFRSELQEVSAEVELILSRLPQSKSTREIRNALHSYRDGEFWWRQIHQPRVVNVSARSFIDVGATPSESFYASTIPYTVAIHWRQANKHLRRAAELTQQKNSTSLSFAK